MWIKKKLLLETTYCILMYFSKLLKGSHAELSIFAHPLSSVLPPPPSGTRPSSRGAPFSSQQH